MPPWILAALAAVLAALPVVVAGALIVGPFVLPLYLKHLSRLDRERLRDATGGIYLIVSGIARHTPTTLDDDVAKIIKMVEQEVGKSLSSKKKLFVANVARSMHADPTKPNLSR